MKKYVLFGAGIVGTGAINYIGKENVIAVIDNNKALVGTLFEGVPVISLEDYIDKYSNLQILISIQTYHYYEVLEQLRENQIKNYFSMPPVLYGFYTPEEIIERFIIKKYKNIALYGINIITDRMIDYIEKYKININVICFVKNERDISLGDTYRGYKVISFNKLPRNTTLILTTSPSEDKIRELIKNLSMDNILDLYEINSRSTEWIHPELEKYKELYAKRRCFIIGNGPSLLVKDLEKLKAENEISFAANGIYHIYDDTNWRPNYYVIVDLFGYKVWMQDGMKGNLQNSFFADYYYTNIKKIEGANYFHYLSSVEETLGFSEDITKGLYSGRTVTYAMIQLACYMGIKEIYLLGVDWTGGKGTGKPRYDFYNKTEILSAQPYDAFMDEKKAFITAKMYAENHGIKIFNATRGGELEVYDRVDFDMLF